MFPLRKKQVDIKPQYDDTGWMTNGAEPWDEYSEELRAMADAESIEYNFESIWELGDMPVIKWGPNFDTFIKKEIDAMDMLADNGYCTLPWVVRDYLLQKGTIKDGTLYFSQGSIGSCSAHGDSFAYHSALATQIGRGSPLEYKPINPIYHFAWSKGGSLSGGQTVTAIAKASNGLGKYPIENVGSNNQSYNKSLQQQFANVAAKHQTAYAFIDGNVDAQVNKIFDVCHAGYGVAFANSTAVSGATTDSNGVKIARISGSWAHMMAWAAYRKVKGTEYIFWINSHGGRYGQSDEKEPADGAWMTRALVAQMMRTANGYGSPYAVLPESTWQRYASITPSEKIAFPATWRT
jgi:hypothetical protein